MEVTTARAVRMARVSRVKFNESVADGFYSCAPPTEEGIVREFMDIDLIVLSIFGRLIEFGMNGRRSGELACEVKNRLLMEPEAESVYVITTHNHTRRVAARLPSKDQYLSAIEFNIWAIKHALNQEYLRLLKADGG